MGWRYKVARNLLAMLPNAPLASSLGKELHPLILITIDMHGGQVNREYHVSIPGKNFLHYKIKK